MADRNLLDYYLGPTGIPDRLRALGELDPVQGIMRGMSASGRAADSDLPPEQRRAAAGEAALETGIALLPVGMGRLARGLTRGARPVAPGPGYTPEEIATIETFVGGTPRREATIRRDDVFRGEGPARVSYPSDTTDPFAIRLTDMNQLQDMIESGLVRPKPGGYGQKRASTLYFGTSQNPDPMSSLFSRPSEGKPVVIMGDAKKLSSYEGGIPLDALSSVMVRQPDGTLLDMLDDILERNAKFSPDDTQKFKDGGLIQTPSGTRRGSVLPATWPEGMSGGEALMSGQAELALPGMIADPINSIAESFMTLDRLRRGESLPKEQVESAGMTLAAVPMSPATLARSRPNTLFANPPSGGRKVQGRFADESTLSRQATANIRAPEAGSMTGATKRQIEDLGSRKAAPGTGEGLRAELAEMSTLRVVRTPVDTARTKIQGAAPQSGQSARYDPVTGEATASYQRKPGDVYRMAADAVAGDASNEWLEVPAGTLERLNMTVGNFTDPKSRVSPDKRTVYLASGPDTARFLQAWQSQAEFFGLPKAPTLTKPSVLPNRSIFGYPTAAKQGKSFEDLKQEARGATVRSQGPTPKSKFFD